MTDFDLVIRNGTIATATDVMDCDIGIRDGTVVALGRDLGSSAKDIDAVGKLVLPGGIDSHCHIDQLSALGIRNADDFESGTIAAAFGGTTTIIPFACQHRGQSLRAVVEDYHNRAGPKAIIDYAFHLIVTDPSPEVLGQELPALIRDGYTSFKIYMTYDSLKLDDYQILDVLSVARRDGALVMVHAENHEMIRWLTDRLLEGGNRAPKYHAVSHARIAESEATHRAISLSELLDVPLLLVHVSTEEAMEEIRQAQARGLKIFGETCPQYLLLTADDLDKPGMDGAMWCCSPPPRDATAQQAIWSGLRNGVFQVLSSDHAPYRYDETGKLAKGPNASFKEIANGIPGIELRLPLLYSEGVASGRIDIHRFVSLTSTNAAKLYGLYPQKGTISIGSDADLAIWDTGKTVNITYDLLHDRAGYTPYEGRSITGWPDTVISRGRVVIDQGALHVKIGSGEFLRCASPDSAKPLGRTMPELDPKQNFGATLNF
jgi:dihydropyrimidinase